MGISKKNQIFLGVILSLGLLGAAPAKVRRQKIVADTYSAVAQCYNDDSLDVVNQDELSPYNPALGRLPQIALPTDCDQVVAASGDQNGVVRVAGRVVYRSRFQEPIDEIRGTPDGVYAIKTANGSIVLLRRTNRGEFEPQVWFHAGFSSNAVREFKLSRTGEVIARTISNELVVGGQVDTGSAMVRELKASRSGRVIAVLDNGEIVDGTSFNASGGTGAPIRKPDFDAVVATKIAADGTVAWLTRDGVLASSRNGRISSDSFDRLTSFHLTANGRTASLSQDGRLLRDGLEIARYGAGHVKSYRIAADGSIAVELNDGAVLSYP